MCKIEYPRYIRTSDKTQADRYGIPDGYYRDFCVIYFLGVPPPLILPRVSISDSMRYIYPGLCCVNHHLSPRT